LHNSKGETVKYKCAVYRSRESTNEPCGDYGTVIWYFSSTDDGSDVWQCWHWAYEKIW